METMRQLIVLYTLHIWLSAVYYRIISRRYNYIFYLGHVTDASVLQQINNQAHYSDASGFISPLSLAIVGRGSCDHRRRNGSRQSASLTT